MSSPEELTFVIGRWLRPVAMLLNMVHPFQRVPISSREQERTAQGD